MNLDPKMFEFMKEVTSSLGRLEEGQKNAIEQLNKVSSTLDEHIGSDDAHGGKVRWGLIRDVILIAGFCLSIFGLMRGSNAEASRERPQRYLSAR